MTDHAAPSPPHYEFDAASERLFRCGADGVTTLFAWPVIHAFRRVAPHRPYAACSPDFVILPVPSAGDDVVGDVPGLDRDAWRAVEAFCATIPPPVREVVARFPERQWDVLSWVARVGLAGEELLVSNPALAFALANAADFQPPTTSSRSLAAQRLFLPYRRQRDIQARLGFPTGEHVRKILRKMLPQVVSVEALTRLRTLLPHRDVVERLAQASAIGPNIIGMMENGTLEHVSIAALRRFAHADAASAPSDVAKQLSEAARVWGTQRTGLRSVAPSPAPRNATDFPPSPFPGTDVIVPLLTRAALLEEGRRQQNCVADCSTLLARGKIAVYQVLSPERCTLSVRLSRGRWRIDQLKAAVNREPRPETVVAVKAWFAQCERDGRRGDAAEHRM